MTTGNETGGSPDGQPHNTHAQHLLRGQYLEATGYVANPKTSSSLARWLLGKYDQLAGFDLSDGPAMAAATDEQMDAVLATGEATGSPLPQSQVFLLVAARNILRVQAGRSKAEIKKDDEGTAQQQLAHEAQKEALVYVTHLFSEHPHLTREWSYPQAPVD